MTEEDSENESPRTEILRKAFVNGLVFLLLGSLIVSIVTSDRGRKMFHGILTFFLLDTALAGVFHSFKPLLALKIKKLI